MCGFTGFVGRFPVERVRAMNALVAHRGPDGEGVWSDPACGVALGHRRLAIIDLRPEADQPMTNEDGTLRLVFNGEIYNYRELRRELEAKGHRFGSNSDTETILHLYEEEGIDAVRRLDGIFAFALWDANRRELLLARDHLGVKPLYYAEMPGGVAFASELKALLVFPEISREVDPVAIDQHLSFIWSASPHTMLRGVRKLEPGRCAVVRDGRVALREPFYDLPYDGERLEGTAADWIEGVRARVESAVERQLVSDVPVAAFLSGGLDSTSVVAMMRRAGAGPVRCYTIDIGDEEGGDDNPEDLPYARLAAARLGVDLHEVRISPDVVSFAERMVYQLDEPQADPACINVHLICQQARADGYKVMLSGAGGDDVFSGYRRHTALLLERYWAWLPRPARRLAAHLAARAGSRSTLARRLGKAFAYADLSRDDRLATYFLWASDDVRRALYSDDLRAALGDYDSLEPLRTSLGRIPAEPDALNRMLYLEAKHFLPDHNLNYTDKMAMAHGVEVRVPLLDLALVNYVVRIPPAEKQRGASGKRLLKEAMRPYLPAEIINRPKTGFGAPLRRWIRRDLREMVHDVLAEEAVARRGLFDPGAVRRLVDRNERGELDASYLVFSLMCVELWMRNFVDRRQWDATTIAEPAALPATHPS
jgi:asparagine synthase (glutamine-hydrolysing)